MDFAKGDEVVYTCCLPDMPGPWSRLRDWGRVVDIKNGYVCWIAYLDQQSEIRRVLPESMSHSPRSPKYYKQLYAPVLANIEGACVRLAKRRVLRDAVLVVLSKENDRVMNSESGLEYLLSL